jgi:hypothetical protein
MENKPRPAINAYTHNGDRHRLWQFNPSASARRTVSIMAYMQLERGTGRSITQFNSSPPHCHKRIKAVSCVESSERPWQPGTPWPHTVTHIHTVAHSLTHAHTHALYTNTLTVTHTHTHLLTHTHTPHTHTH